MQKTRTSSGLLSTISDESFFKNSKQSLSDKFDFSQIFFVLKNFQNSFVFVYLFVVVVVFFFLFFVFFLLFFLLLLLFFFFCFFFVVVVFFFFSFHSSITVKILLAFSAKIFVTLPGSEDLFPVFITFI